MPKAPREAQNPGCTAVALMLALAGAGCADEQTSEPTVDARPGIEQVGSADGPLLDEGEACERMQTALDGAKERESCNDVVVEDCPELIRPAASLACVRFSEESVTDCVQQVGRYDSCGDFSSDACIVVAVVDETTEGCVPPGPPPDAGSGDEGSQSDAGLPDDEGDDAGIAADDDVEPEPESDDDTEAPSDAGGAVEGDDDVTDPGPVDSGSDPEPIDPIDSGVSPSDSGVPSIDAGPGAPSDAAVATDASVAP